MTPAKYEACIRVVLGMGHCEGEPTIADFLALTRAWQELSQWAAVVR